MTTVTIDPPVDVQGTGTAVRRDNREEIADASAAAQKWFESIGAIIPVSHHHMQQQPDGSWALGPQHALMGQAFNVVGTERFREQPVVAVGAAFLVHPQVVLTARHIVPNARIARQVRLVFGFGTNGNQSPKVFPAEDVYEMTPIWSNRSSDLTLCMLDRAVRDTRGQARVPLALRLKLEIRDREKLSVIGFPLGLPGKFAGNGVVTRQTREFFFADLDVMRGNSGSPVFSEETGEVVGVVSTAPLGLTPVNGFFTADFSRDRGDVEVGISKITNARMPD